MREIKFRAWHFGQNRMFSAEEMTHDQMALLPDGHFANIHGGDTSKSTIYPHTSMMPLQFTGLHDKNGKEIYEGDIVDQVAMNVVTGVIEYDAPEWRLKSIHSGMSFALTHLPYALEVIGNIYEDEELLSGA